MFRDLGDRVCVDQRTDRHAPVEPVTDLKARDRGHELGGEGVIDAVLNEETVGAYAGLAGIAELGRERPLDRRVEIGVVEDDEGGVAPELEAQLLDLVGALPHQDAPDLGRSGEGNLADLRICRELASQLRARRRRKDAEKAGRHPGALGEQARSEEHTSELQSLMRNSYAV